VRTARYSPCFCAPVLCLLRVPNPLTTASTPGGTALPNNGLNGEVNALLFSGSDLYVGGAFTQTADGAVTNLNNIARFSGGVWSALPNNGLNTTVNALAVSGSDLYVGGNFGQTADAAVHNLNFIAKLSSGFNVFLPLVIR
jgi:hypothetical protein